MAVSLQTQRLRLVLLPVMDGTGELFLKFAAALSEEFEIATVCYPTERCLSYYELEDLVRAACPVSGPFVLLAESYSTPLAIRCAASSLGSLQGLVLCAGFATSPVRGWRRLLGWLVAPLLFCLPMPKLAARFWPDCDFVDGEVRERNLGTFEHSRMQALVAGWSFQNEEA